MRKDLAEFDNFTAPGVEMHCLYGSNIGDTVDRFGLILLLYIFSKENLLNSMEFNPSIFDLFPL